MMTITILTMMITASMLTMMTMATMMNDEDGDADRHADDWRKCILEVHDDVD